MARVDNGWPMRGHDDTLEGVMFGGMINDGESFLPHSIRISETEETENIMTQSPETMTWTRKYDHFSYYVYLHVHTLYNLDTILATDALSCRGTWGLVSSLKLSIKEKCISNCTCQFFFPKCSNFTFLLSNFFIHNIEFSFFPPCVCFVSR